MQGTREAIGYLIFFKAHIKTKNETVVHSYVTQFDIAC